MVLADDVAHHAGAFLEARGGSSLSWCMAQSRRRCTGFSPSRTSGSERAMMVDMA
jgi:hypothetical protein